MNGMGMSAPLKWTPDQ